MSKSDTTKAMIMRAAVHEFSALGYRGVAVRDIAHAAGVTMGVIRYHFGSKADLYRDTLACLAEQFNAVCQEALDEVRSSPDPRDLIYAWLAAPITRWRDATIASGEEVLRFLNKMGYEEIELTREVYESHYAYAQQEWAEAVRERFPGISHSDWLWCLTCLRGMYFNIVAHHRFILWSLPTVQNKEQALHRLAADAAALFSTYQTN